MMRDDSKTSVLSAIGRVQNAAARVGAWETSVDEVRKALEEHALTKGDARSRRALEHFDALVDSARKAGVP